MTQRTSFTFALDSHQQQRLIEHLRTGNYRPREAPYTRIAAEAENCTIALYTSGKCVVQGKGAEDWVKFVLEPEILREARLGYERYLNPEQFEAHIGVDESGKGDFFGPLVIAAAYSDDRLVDAFQKLNVRDSKQITSDRVALDLADELTALLGDRRELVIIGPRTYNRLYAKLGNVNEILAWGHARAIENLLERVPGVARAVSDQFGPVSQVQRALFERGRKIKLEQRPRAESDPAVAAASVLARAAFLRALMNLKKNYDIEFPKGASAAVRKAAVELVRKYGPLTLLDVAKCHFKTADSVLEEAGYTRDALGPEGAAVSKPPSAAQTRERKKKKEEDPT